MAAGAVPLDLVLHLVSTGVGVDEAAPRLLADGTDVEVLTEIERFLRGLDSDPSARDRALLLVERTRLLAEHAATAAQESDRLRADASRTPTPDDGSPFEAVRGLLHHELSTPVAVARSALELLGELDDDPATAQQMVVVARRNLNMAGHLLQSWGRAERLQSGRAELSWAQVDLGELVRECVADVGALLLERREVRVTVEQAIELPADPYALRQILFNLLTNAAKFSPDDSLIEVTVTAAGGHAHLAVSDRGPGVRPQDAVRIFEAGQRVDPDAPGIGVGLFVARHLAQAHAGDLHVEDAPGGARFVLRLPLSSSHWQRSLERREEAATTERANQRNRDAIANARHAALDQRDDVADQRDAALDAREELANERDAGLDPRRDST